MQKQRKKHTHRDPEWDSLTFEERMARAREGSEYKAKMKAEHEREVAYRCAWGCCVNFYDPVKHQTTWGYGAIGCPCDNLPGWKAKHPLMLPKPAWPTKVVGRNGSRVQRTRRRHRGVAKNGMIMKWAVELDREEDD